MLTPKNNVEVKEIYYEVNYLDNDIGRRCICKFDYKEIDTKIPEFVTRKKSQNCVDFKISLVKTMKYLNFEA